MGDSRIAAGVIQVGAGGLAPCLQRSDYERTIRRKSCAGWPAGRRTSTRADGFCRWQGFETEWPEGRPRGSAAWTARRCAIGFTASTPRVRRGFSITGRKARSPAFGRMAKAHRSTRNDHIHRNARLGPRPSPAMTLGISGHPSPPRAAIRAHAQPAEGLPLGVNRRRSQQGARTDRSLRLRSAT